MQGFSWRNFSSSLAFLFLLDCWQMETNQDGMTERRTLKKSMVNQFSKKQWINLLTQHVIGKSGMQCSLEEHENLDATDTSLQTRG